MQQSDYTYFDNDLPMTGYLALDDTSNEPKPAVLVVHDWSGRNDFACAKADMLAKLGYVGFAVDMYGDGRTGDTIEEKQALMTPLVNDRLLLKNRILSAFEAVKNMDEVNPEKIAAIGFCFGGLCVLDLARTGEDLKGVVSLHGLLNKPEDMNTKDVQARVLALHGYDDPMVPPDQVNAFCEEMTQAKVDWQVHMYGHTKHAFTNPQANDESIGTIYDAHAEKRALQAMKNFLEEIFQD